jgi:hypothetical protein
MVHDIYGTRAPSSVTPALHTARSNCSRRIRGGPYYRQLGNLLKIHLRYCFQGAFGKKQKSLMPNVSTVFFVFSYKLLIYIQREREREREEERAKTRELTTDT